MGTEGMVGLEVVLWRAVAAFRFAALGYAAILVVHNLDTFNRPWLAWTVLAVMAVWSVVATLAYARPARHGWPLLITDLVLTIACLLASHWVITPESHRGGSGNLPMVWIAAVVAAWAFAGGRWRGVVAALSISAADLWLRGSVTIATINVTVLLLLTGFILGYVVRLAQTAEKKMQHAIELEAATKERERLARGIHDSVLQLLAMISKRGGELGQLAAEQEATLRALISVAPRPPGQQETDLRESLRPFASAQVQIASPATTVPVPAKVADELAAAVNSALDNVRRHGGPHTRAWVLLEDEGDSVTVTIRDNGPGFPNGRLAQAAREGRLGVAQSIIGRIRDIGGTASVTSHDGTEVELRVPR